MLLTKDGVTFDVNHPSDIARLKHSGFTEIREEEPEQKKHAGGRPRKGPSDSDTEQPPAESEGKE